MTATESVDTAEELPLRGVRVLDLTHVWSGPMGTRVLTALGAEMVKLESPRKPDMLRGPGPGDIPLRYPDLAPGPESHNRNAWFNTQNTGKRDVVLDLKTEEGLALARRLVTRSDLVVANYRPGVLDRIGLGYDALRRIKPDIIVLEMPGYPAGTPQANAPAFGAQFDANSGSAALTGDEESPLLTGYALGDPTAGLFGAAAAVSALVRHRRTGKGGHIILPQSESMMPLLGEYYLAESVGKAIVEVLNGDRRCAPHGIYPTGDGHWLAVAIQNDEQWRAFARRLDAHDPGIGARVLTSADRRANAHAVEAAVRAWAASIVDPAGTAALLQAEGIPSAPLQDAEALCADPQLAAAGYFSRLYHPSCGTHAYPTLPISIGGVRAAPVTAAPRFGEDTEWCLRELLGENGETIRDLTARGIVSATSRAKTETAMTKEVCDMNEAVSYESIDGVAVVTIRRPDQMNALNNAVIDGLRDAWARYQDGPDRCAVLTSEGDRAFSVGADLKDPPTEMWEGVPGTGVVLDKPVIAAITGHCIGGAYVIVQHCDLAVAAESTKFSYPEAKVGLSGGMVASAVGRIPHKAAMELMLLGGPIHAQRAYEMGIVNRVVADGEHVAVAMELARRIADSAPLVVSMMKRFADSTVVQSPSEQHANARRELLTVQRSKDRVEGTAAFREKRPPQFSGS